MNSSRLKSIIIIILLLVNVCFLFIYFLARYDSAVLENQTRSGIVQLLSKNGIVINEDIIPKASPQDIYNIHREKDAERQLVEAVLGPVEVIDQGGNVFQYKNNNGRAEFRISGRFDITIYKYPTGNKSAEELSESLLEMMGLTAKRGRAEGTSSDEIREVSYICSFNEKEIFNCGIEFTYYANGRVEIHGNKIIGSQSYMEQAEMLSEITVLVGFLKEIKGKKDISEIRTMEIGYVMSANAATLQPAWRIITDAGYFYFDAVTGKLIA